MNILKSVPALVVGVCVVAGAHTPAAAASAVTNVFLTNLVPNVDFLDRSSRFALTNSKNAPLRDFAHSEAAEQTLAANTLDAWIEADRNVAVAQRSSDSDALKTGRSVAVQGVAVQGVAFQGQVAPPVDKRLAMGQEDLDSLEGLEAQEFDELYRAKQLDALTQVRTDYQTYIATGDDPALKAMAVEQLPKIDRRLAALGKL